MDNFLSFTRVNAARFVHPGERNEVNNNKNTEVQQRLRGLEGRLRCPGAISPRRNCRYSRSPPARIFNLSKGSTGRGLVRNRLTESSRHSTRSDQPSRPGQRRIGFSPGMCPTDWRHLVELVTRTIPTRMERLLRRTTLKTTTSDEIKQIPLLNTSQK